MSYVIAHPEMMTSAASDLAAIASNVNAAHIMAAAPTTAVIPAAADEVSTSIAHLFSQHAASYQAMAGQAAATVPRRLPCAASHQTLRALPWRTAVCFRWNASAASSTGGTSRLTATETCLSGALRSR